MISIQDNKIDKLIKRVINLEQILREAQFCNLIATNASELPGMEVDKVISTQVVPCDIRCRPTTEQGYQKC